MAKMRKTKDTIIREKDWDKMISGFYSWNRGFTENHKEDKE